MLSSLRLKERRELVASPQRPIIFLPALTSPQIFSFAQPNGGVRSGTESTGVRHGHYLKTKSAVSSHCIYTPNMAAVELHTAVQALSISIALAGAGGIAALSLFDIPEIRSQPADRALPMIRWLFSRGSHIFPQASVC